MDDYDLINKTRLRLKGDKKKKRKRHHPPGESSLANDKNSQQTNEQHELAEDAEEHGGWWKTTRYEHIKGEVAIELLPGCYAKSLSNGRIVLGNPHAPGEAPEEEEIFSVIPAGINQIALKSGFDRYLSIDNLQRLIGVSEAIGEPETFLPVFEDGRTALSSVLNDCFISVDDDSDVQQIVAKSSKAGQNEMLNIRLNCNPHFNDKHLPSDSRQVNNPEKLGTVLEIEMKYLKNNKKIDPERLNEEKKRLKRARLDGQLYGAMLDTRVKHKSDKYCK